VLFCECVEERESVCGWLCVIYFLSLCSFLIFVFFSFPPFLLSPHLSLTLILQGTNEYSNLQKILIRIVIVLVIMSSVLCSIVFIYLCVTKISPVEALSFTVVLMVASIPMAIEIVTTTTLALGSKELSKHGAIGKCCVRVMFGDVCVVVGCLLCVVVLCVV
jgi:E1-E2 ATPase